MNEILINYIQEQLLNNEFEEKIDPEDDLLGGDILDSLGMMRLIAFIETEFNTKIPPNDMVIENFMTVGHITDYLQKNMTI